MEHFAAKRTSQRACERSGYRCRPVCGQGGTMRTRLLALIASLHCSVVAAQTGPCPCSNRAVALTHLTSSRPIPAEHAACLKAIDDYTRWLEQNESRIELPQFKKLFAPLLPGLVSVDWVVPSKAE